jgi:hypothetical protein
MDVWQLLQRPKWRVKRGFLEKHVLESEREKEDEKCNDIVAPLHLAYFSIGTPIRLPHSVQEPS